MDRSRSFDLSRFSFFDFLPELLLLVVVVVVVVAVADAVGALFSSYFELILSCRLLLLELARGGDAERFGLRLAGFGLGGRFDGFSLLRSRSFVVLFSFRFSSRRSCFSSDFLDDCSLLPSFGVLPDLSFLSRFSLLLFSDERSFGGFCDEFLLPLLVIGNLLLLLLLLLSFGSGEFFELIIGDPNKFSNVLVGFMSSDFILCFLLLLLLLLLPPTMPTLALPLLCGRDFVVESG